MHSPASSFRSHPSGQAPMMEWSGSPLGQLSSRPRRAGRAEPRTKRENLKSPHPSVDPDRSGSDLLGLNKSGGGFQQWVRLKAGADAENVGGVELSRVFPPSTGHDRAVVASNKSNSNGFTLTAWMYAKVSPHS
jgi:hypothetical protein